MATKSKHEPSILDFKEMMYLLKYDIKTFDDLSMEKTSKKEEKAERSFVDYVIGDKNKVKWRKHVKEFEPIEIKLCKHGKEFEPIEIKLCKHGKELLIINTIEEDLHLLLDEKNPVGRKNTKFTLNQILCKVVSLRKILK